MGRPAVVPDLPAEKGKRGTGYSEALARSCWATGVCPTTVQGVDSSSHSMETKEHGDPPGHQVPIPVLAQWEEEQRDQSQEVQGQRLGSAQGQVDECGKHLEIGTRK